MANVRLLFFGTEKSLTYYKSIELFCNKNSNLTIIIKDKEFKEQVIELDKSSAIKFSRELRKQISLML